MTVTFLVILTDILKMSMMKFNDDKTFFYKFTEF